MRLAGSLLVLALLSLCRAQKISRFSQHRHSHRLNIGQNLEVNYPYTTHWYNTKMNHFSPTDTRTFKLRYLVNTDHYEKGGALFFYTGNEGPIDALAEATGIMWDLAKLFKAVLVFGEHRYYGESQPFGTYEKAFNSSDNLAYFSSEQALADYAALLTDLRSDSNNTDISFPSDTKAIAFGGSYGGLLTAWFRKKYPHVVTGAWASSAPVVYFNGGGIDYGAFDKVITDTFRKSDCNVDEIARSWTAIRNVAKTADGRALLNKAFSVDNSSLLTGKPGDADNLIGYLYQALVWMATTDYPYPANFVSPMPGWPAKVSCTYVPKGKTFATDEDLAVAMASLTDVYFNSNNDSNYRACFDDTCGNPASEMMGTPLAWPWQLCTEIYMPVCYRGMPNDFFVADCPSDGSSPLKDDRRYCAEQFKGIGYKMEMLNEDAVPLEYGISYDSASNLIITQGELDPSSAGALTVNEADNKRGLFALTIKNAAHHLDFRTPNTCDPSNLAPVRYQIVRIMQCWLDSTQCPSSYTLTDAESIISHIIPINCTDIIEGFPWGQKDAAADTTTTTPKSTPTTTSPQTTTNNGGGGSLVLFSAIAALILLLNL